jgi:hypothetical protein
MVSMVELESRAKRSKFVQRILSKVVPSFMADASLDKWDENSKERERAKRKKDIVTLLNLGLMTCWGFTIIWGGFLYAHDGWSSMLAPNYDPSWTAFSYGMIWNLILLSCLVTIIYAVSRLHLRRSDMHALVSMKDT